MMMSSNVTLSEEASEAKTNSNPLRVLIVVDSTFPGPGGAESQARKLAASLDKKGVVAEFLSPRILEHQGIDTPIDGLPSHRIDYPKIRVMGGAILVLRFAWYLFKRRNDFDVIHVHITRLLAATAVAMRPLTGLPVIAKISGFFEFNGGVLDTDSRSIGNSALRYLLRRINYVQTISEQTREKLVAAGFSDSQIRFIPNGIDTAQRVARKRSRAATHSRASDALVFGYCGRLRRVKGIQVLINSFAELVKSRPGENVKLRIAGGGSAINDLRARCHELGVSHHVQWLGEIENTADFYETLDVYIQPSFAEGLPNSVMEAMLAGLPVLATDIGGNNDLIDHDQEGWLFDAGDVQALSSLMGRCLDEPSALNRLGAQGRERLVTSYDFSIVTTKLMELYRGEEN